MSENTIELIDNFTQVILEPVIRDAIVIADRQTVAIKSELIRLVAEQQQGPVGPPGPPGETQIESGIIDGGNF